MLGPIGAASPIPGLTGTAAPIPGATPSPMEALARLLGQRTGGQTSTVDKMAQVVQLLREISKGDPRLAELAGDALRLLIEGPPGGGASSPASGATGMPGVGPSSAMLLGASQRMS